MTASLCTSNPPTRPERRLGSSTRSRAASMTLVSMPYSPYTRCLSITASICSAFSATQIVPHASYSTALGSDGISSRHSSMDSAVSASCSGESSIATRCPMPAAVVPPPAKAASSTVTESPSRASACAQAAPTMPAPTTMAWPADALTRPRTRRRRRRWGCRSGTDPSHRTAAYTRR